MEQYYILIIGILFLFAIIDVIVGVSNDAVNFLSSAIGAKAAPFWVIMIVASLGVMIGAITSDGMMEVARNGIFVPSMLSFNEVMLIFVGVMLTDIVLLNTFNSFGLPTSTTVSLIFELIGGSVAMAVIKLNQLGQPLSEMFEYINTAKAISIVTGIFTAIIIAFVFGSVIQWFVRLIVSFNYESFIKKYGAIYGGIAITVITYFMLIKGAKHAAFMTKSVQEFIAENSIMLWVYSAVGWTVILQILKMIFNIDVLKITVLVGTFALALAFAGNDLVNFIGVPLAGWNAFESFKALGSQSDSFLMTSLEGAVKTPIVFLLLAGIVMVMTLYLSKKAKNVTQTTLNLSNQSEGDEQFGSSAFARVMVRSIINFSNKIGVFIPQSVKNFVKSRFQQPKGKGKKKASFDMLRASVTLIVSSMLITIGTSYKLPLSTTYVTFMVAMATSFADGAWGRETAVYRITGVFTVIAGWFLTAFIAFSVTAIVVYLLFVGHIYSLAILFFIAMYILFTSAYGKKKKIENKESEFETISLKSDNIISLSSSYSLLVFNSVKDILNNLYAGFDAYNLHELRKAKHKAIELDKEVKKLKDSVSVTLHDENEESNYSFVQQVDYMRELARSTTLIVNPSFAHVNNNHKPLIQEQKQELYELNLKFIDFIGKIETIINSQNFNLIEDLKIESNELFNFISKIRKKQLKRLKMGEINTRNSLLYIQILHEAKQTLAYSINIVKSYRDIVKSKSI